MGNKNILKRLSFLVSPVLIIIAAVVLRLLPHPPNFAPIAGLALFGGAYLNKRYALIIPILTMFFSDLFLGFHNTIIFVYGSFLLTGVIGLWLRNKKNLVNVTLASVSASIIFFLITNFGVWLVSGMYEKTLLGLTNSYILALPFFRNTLLGDLFYTGVFFGGYELVKRLIFRLSIKSNV